VKPLGLLREEAFYITYHSNLGWQDVMEMDPDDREWYVDRLDRQIRKENRAAKGK